MPKKLKWQAAPDKAGAWWARYSTLVTVDLFKWTPGSESWSGRYPAAVRGEPDKLEVKIFGLVNDWTPWRQPMKFGPELTLRFESWAPRSINLQPAARWKDFMARAVARIRRRGGLWSEKQGGYPIPGQGTFEQQVADEIMRYGDGEAFLKAARRGRSTQRQNLRYQLLREVELRMGDAVPRRRPDANTPDAIALRAPKDLKLEIL